MNEPTSQWIDVGTAAAVTEESRLDTEVEGYYVAIVRRKGELFAFEDRCTHDGESLAGAELDDDSAAPCGVVVCPRHGARFCLRTGAVLAPPAYEPLRLFTVRERDGRLELRRP